MEHQHPQPSDMRRAAFQPATLNPDARTIELTWTTGARGRRASWFDGDWYEELDMSSGAVRLDRLNNGASLLNSHQSADLSNILGVVERAWIENGEGRARVRFSERAEVEPIFRDVASGIIRNVSVGYQVHKWSDPIRGVDDEPPTYRALDWEPMELSLVGVPFDAKAQTRSQPIIPDTSMPDNLNKQAGGDPAEQQPASQARSTDPTPPPVPAVDTELQRTASELRRERDLLRLGQDAGLTSEQTDELIRSGKTVMECSREAVRLMRLRLEGGDVRDDNGPAALGHPARVEVTRDSGDTLLRGISAGLEARIRPGVLKGEAAELGREFRSYTLLELARQCLEMRGVNTRGMSKTELVTRGFHSTSDFPLLFSNLAGKTLDAAYEEEPHTWRPIARQRNLPDFKQANDLIVAGALTPEPLLEGGEYKAGTLVEGQHTWRLATYARKISLTRQAIINDDLSAMEEVPEMMGRGFRRLESNLIWGLFTGNALTSIDGLSLFNASHNNMGGSTGLTISTSGFNTAEKAMRKQTDLAGNVINISPSYLIVPTDLKSTAMQFLFPTGFAPSVRTGDNGPVVNAQTANMELIVEPRLDGAADVWYLAASPGAVQGIVYGYLAGEEGPTVTTSEKRDPDGIELLARFDFGTAVKDWRGFYRSKNV
jgi:hypothetical protein